ncbi:hypothetical protein PybrP1_000865 [[Pythium] brassicae (nom. inval.)]|nr:hypothetical protein PybrP1_000865 [[Pythium] brassicae (nom. inval.)]
MSCLAAKAYELEVSYQQHGGDVGNGAKDMHSYFAVILFVIDQAQGSRRRSTGQRVRFAYHIPYVGHVCKDSVQNCNGVSPSTVARCELQVQSGTFVGRTRRGSD